MSKPAILLVIFFISVFSCGSKLSKSITKDIIAYKKVGGNILNLHFFSSEKKEKKPVVVFFHPGGWFSGSPVFFNEKAKEYALLGYTAISVEYRLADFKTKTPVDCVEDAIDALKYLKISKDKLNLDLSNLFIIGYSAGGHLAMMSQLSKDKSVPLAKKIFAIASPVSLIEDEMLKSTNMSIEDMVKISPSEHIKNLKTQLFLYSGTNDEYVNYTTITNFTSKAKQNNVDVHLNSFKNAGHFLLSEHKNEIEQKIKQEILKK